MSFEPARYLHGKSFLSTFYYVGTGAVLSRGVDLSESGSSRNCNSSFLKPIRSDRNDGGTRSERRRKWPSREVEVSPKEFNANRRL